MKTISVPRPEYLHDLNVPEQVRLVLWDCISEPRDAQGNIVPIDEINIVVVQFNASEKHLTNINACKNLELVQTVSVGFDALAGKLKPGVKIANMKGFNNDATSELAVALLLAYLRQIPDMVRHQDQNKWKYLVSDTLSQKKVLLLGVGDIGTSVARKLEAFDAQVTRMGRTAREGVLGIDAFMEQVPLHDIVFIMLPLTGETRGMINATVLEAMPDGAILVNAGRGPIVITDDLIAELRTGRISAVLDVVDPEPLPASSPLWDMKNVLISPHVAGETVLIHHRALKIIEKQAAALDICEDYTNVVYVS